MRKSARGRTAQALVLKRDEKPTEDDEQRCDIFPRTALLTADHRRTRTKFRGPQEPKAIIQERDYGGLDLCRVLEMMRNG